jgi:NAD(P)-dependent dehydrogenase (short-subunit alcohol dehydrogenase family)
MLAQMKFAGEVAVVTGGGGGIGRSCAQALAELDATVLVVGRTEAKLKDTKAHIADKGGRCETFVADVASESEVGALRDHVERRWGRAKALINNAGNNFAAPITELATQKWHDIIAVDLDSIFFMCRAFIPLLLKAERPSILNVASTFGHIGNPHMPVYCAAKGGVISLTRQLAVDYGKQGLRVNSICPGPTLSPRVKGYFDRDPADMKRVQSLVMLGRLGECDEIGNVAAFLVSDAASFVHGASIVVDGGQTIN